MSDSAAHLIRVSREYERLVGEYPAIANEAAEAYAAHRYAKACAFADLRIVMKKAIGECETLADADEVVHAAHQRRLVAEAARDAAAKKLWQMAAQVDVGRSLVSHERQSDAAHANTSGRA